MEGLYPGLSGGLTLRGAWHQNQGRADTHAHTMLTWNKKKLAGEFWNSTQFFLMPRICTKKILQKIQVLK